MIKIFLLLLTLLPIFAHGAEDKTEINGLYFDLFDHYASGTCRFTADFGPTGMQSTYSGSITIPSTVTHNNKTYTVTTLGASVFGGSTGVTSLYIPNTITAIENLDGASTMKAIMCNIEDPNTIKDSQSNGKIISTNNGNLYRLGTYTDDCLLVVPAGSKSAYTTNGWGTVFTGGIYEGIVIIADDKTMTYGNTRPQFTWSHYKVKDDPINGSPAFTCSGNSSSPVGTYSIVITANNLQTNDITNFKHGTLTINKAPLTVTAKSYTINQGDPLPAFECTYSGFKNSETNSVLTTQPTITCSATSSSAPGTYDIVVSGGSATNYEFTYVKGTLTIEAVANNNIQFADSNVKALCVANWDTNGDEELSYAEAAAVTDLGLVFKDNTAITSFDELQYFTGLTSIGYQAFYGCSGLTAITIPNSVTSIGTYAFCRCSGFTSVTIPNSVTSIGQAAFSNCSGLTSVTIPNSVTSIGSYAFSNCWGLTSITIPNSVRNFGWHAFEGCSGLTSVTIPNCVTSIGINAFSGCSSLTSITIPNSVTYIGNSAFMSCSSLTSVTIPNSVTRIGGCAFWGCTALTSVTIPNSVTNIESQAFDKCI